jgi:lysophospholipase L1-like esterase
MNGISGGFSFSRPKRNGVMTMKKSMYVFICILALIFSFNITVNAAKPVPSANNTIRIEKTVDNNPTDTAEFSITLLKDGKYYGEGIVTVSLPLVFTNLPDGRYSITEAPKDGYSLVSISPASVRASKNSTYTFQVVNHKDDSIDPPPPTDNIYYVALGDSIGTGATSRGTTSSYVVGFYNFLINANPSVSVTLRNLSTNGDDSSDLLGKLRADTNCTGDVAKATILTLNIGGNNVLPAGESSFSVINHTVAEEGTLRFESEYQQIIDEIRRCNATVEIITMTLFNPYNALSIRYYEGDPVLHQQVEFYAARINAKIRGISDPNYRFAEVHDIWKSQYADLGKMGSVTYFYPNVLLKFTRDPHPNQTGQNILTEMMKQAYLNTP